MKRVSSKKAQPKPPAKSSGEGARAAKEACQSKDSQTERSQSRRDTPHSADLVEQVKEQLEIQNAQLRAAHTDLEQTRHRYADLYNSAPIGFMTLNAQGCIYEINHTATELVGHPLSHLLGKPVIPYLAQADRKAFLKHLWECQHQQQEKTITLRLLNKNTGERLVEFTTRPAHDLDSQGGWCHSAISDVTEKRRITTALSESEAKFRLLAENIGEVFWFMQLDPPRVTYVSPAFERIWGQPVGNLYADHGCWEGGIHPDDLPAVHAAYQDWISGQTNSYRVEYRVLPPGGPARWISDRGIIIKRSDGRPVEISGIAHDITERKQGEALLEEKLRESQAILDSAFDGILIADSETRRFTFCNQAMCRMLGVTREELLTMSLESIHPPELLPILREKFAAISRGELSMVENTPLRRKDGSILRADISAAPVMISGRLCNVGIFHDLSERHQAEQRFRNLLEAAPDAMIIVNQHGLIDEVNAQTVNLFGYTRDELLSQPLEMLMPERFRKHHVSHRTGYAVSPHARPMGKGMELFAQHKNGGEFPVEISLSPLETAEGTVVISAVHDITERKLAENEILHARNFAESTLEAVPASLAVLNADGIIVGTNQAWHQFARLNGGPEAGIGNGVNYLAVCDAAAGDRAEQAAHFAQGIRDVMSGERKRFSMEYPCHAPDQQRWFVGYVTPFMGNGPHSVVVAHVDISERKQAEETIRQLNEKLEDRVARRTAALRIANEDLREEIAKRLQLEHEISHISDLERQRIGQDLHDDLGQQIAGISLLSGVLKRNLADQGSSEVGLADDLIGLLKDALVLTRSLARGLQPVALDAGGLSAALEELSVRTSTMFRIQCKSISPARVMLDNAVATHLYRIAQEAVTNAVKHAAASQIRIELCESPPRTILSIKDNGSGMPAKAAAFAGGMGLRIMRYRADLIGGILEFQHPAEGGTMVVCTCLPPQPPSSTNLSYGKKILPKDSRISRKKGVHCR